MFEQERANSPHPSFTTKHIFYKTIILRLNTSPNLNQSKCIEQEEILYRKENNPTPQNASQPLKTSLK